MRFRAIELGVRDPAASARFLVETLGLAPAGPNGAQAGATRVSFFEAEGGTHHVAFNVPEDGLAQAKAWLRARGVALVHHDGADEVAYPEWNAHAAYFRAPDGTLYEVIARHALRNGSPAPFGADGFVEVSEVAMVVPDVPRAVQALADALGVSAWRPPSERFAAVGDEHGLLIVVRDGRSWFPTDDPATPAPWAARVEGLARTASPIEGRPYRFLPG